MAIWLRVATVVFLLTTAPSLAQELVKVPVQIPAITPAVSAFALARDRGYYKPLMIVVPLPRKAW